MSNNLYRCNTGDKKAKEMIEKFPDTLTMSFSGLVRQGCGTKDHGCSGSGSINIYTSIYNYLTVVSNTRFTNISTGPVTPNTMLVANYTASSSDKGSHQGTSNSDAALTIRLERR